MGEMLWGYGGALFVVGLVSSVFGQVGSGRLVAGGWCGGAVCFRACLSACASLLAAVVSPPSPLCTTPLSHTLTPFPHPISSPHPSPSPYNGTRVSQASLGWFVNKYKKQYFITLLIAAVTPLRSRCSSSSSFVFTPRIKTASSSYYYYYYYYYYHHDCFHYCYY